ncbi:MAG TPA: hypothetical protein PK542_02975 [Treponemataceae bacterium]|nr:hypothetical protein [Treponemataceae bacterium]HPS43430.1 hypothetical protein [Treponemataceae bacterium]
MTKTIIAEDPKIRELREKIKDEGYIQGAIQRIALVLCDRLIEVKEINHERQY